MADNPESRNRHDIEVNRRFIALMDDNPEMADVVRAITVGLPINDPPRPAPKADAEPEHPTTNPRRRIPPLAPTRPRNIPPAADDKGALNFTDADGDAFRAVPGTAPHGPDPVLHIRTSDAGVFLPLHHLPPVIAWLALIHARGKGEQGGETARA